MVLKKRDEIDDMEALERPERILSRNPLAFSTDRANAEIDLAERELDEGKGINETEMHRFFEEWRKRLE